MTTPPTDKQLAEWRRKTDALRCVGARSLANAVAEAIGLASEAMPILLVEVERLRSVLRGLANEACAGDAICTTQEPRRDLVIANGVDPDVCKCFRATAREALEQ